MEELIQFWKVSLLVDPPLPQNQQEMDEQEVTAIQMEEAIEDLAVLILIDLNA